MPLLVEGVRSLGRPAVTALQGVMWQSVASIISFATTSMLFSPQLGSVLAGNQLFLRLFLVMSVAVQTFVFMHLKKAATFTSTLLARLLSPPPTSST